MNYHTLNFILKKIIDIDYDNLKQRVDPEWSLQTSFSLIAELLIQNDPKMQSHDQEIKLTGGLDP